MRSGVHLSSFVFQFTQLFTPFNESLKKKKMYMYLKGPNYRDFSRIIMTFSNILSGIWNQKYSLKSFKSTFTKGTYFGWKALHTFPLTTCIKYLSYWPNNLNFHLFNTNFNYLFTYSSPICMIIQFWKGHFSQKWILMNSVGQKSLMAGGKFPNRTSKPLEMQCISLNFNLDNPVVPFHSKQQQINLI